MLKTSTTTHNDQEIDAPTTFEIIVGLVEKTDHGFMIHPKEVVHRAFVDAMSEFAWSNQTITGTPTDEASSEGEPSFLSDPPSPEPCGVVTGEFQVPASDRLNGQAFILKMLRTIARAGCLATGQQSAIIMFGTLNEIYYVEDDFPRRVSN